jgi:hypothetical protein
MHGCRLLGQRSSPFHRALKLGEGARQLKEQLAGRRSRVDILLIQVEIDVDGFEVLDSPYERDLKKKCKELARVRERLEDPDLRPGIARELRGHIAILEREIAELEQA